MDLRRDDGYKRYAVGAHYHGASSLGFSYYQNERQDCIMPDATDLRGYLTKISFREYLGFSP